MLHVRVHQVHCVFDDLEIVYFADAFFFKLESVAAHQTNLFDLDSSLLAQLNYCVAELYQLLSGHTLSLLPCSNFLKPVQVVCLEELR